VILQVIHEGKENPFVFMKFKCYEQNK